MKNDKFLIAVLGFLGAFLGVLVPTYFGPYFQGTINQRAELAQDLSAYYSSASIEYYTRQDKNAADVEGIDVSSAYYVELMKEDNQNYKNFLAASTKLETEIPPNLRTEVLSLEDSYESLPTEENSQAEDAWFNQLDNIRVEILSATVFQKNLNPIWK